MIGKMKWKLRSDAIRRPATYTITFGAASLTFEVDKDGWFEADCNSEVPLGVIARPILGG
jgi:hypothetical protein